MSKRIAIGAILCMAVLVPSATGHSHHGKAHVKVTLDSFTKNPFPGTENGFFKGSVGSPKASCKKDRMLRVFAQKNGNDKAVGQGKAFEETPGKPTPFDITGHTEKSGKYYVKAAATPQCKVAQSRSININVN
ncbi:hypothetical protein BH10ACT11_BH10ACT11_21650 [soil metagenome]